MDPVTVASKTFQRELARLWKLGRASVRVECSAADRTDMVKTLRLAEWDPDNRWPMFLHEAPFTDATSWFEGLAASLEGDYAAIVAGAREEGVALPAYEAPPVTAGSPVARALLVADRVARCLQPRLDGALVALAPKQVADRDAWALAVQPWLDAGLPRGVRVVVHDLPGGPLAARVPDDATARFAIDQDALNDYLKGLGAKPSEGPPLPPGPQLSPEQRAAVEASTGRKIPSPEAGRALRAEMLDASQKMGHQDWLGASQHFRAAQRVCQSEGLVAEEAAVLVGMASLCLAASQRDVAAQSFERAAALATEHALWQVVAQACMGLGALHTMARDHVAAASAYERAAAASEKARVDALTLESLRMAGTCHTMAGDERAAMRAWRRAVDGAEAMDAPARESGTFAQTAESLAALLTRHGMHPQAAHVRSMIPQGRG